MKIKTFSLILLIVLVSSALFSQNSEKAPLFGKRIVLGFTVGTGVDWLSSQNEKFTTNGGYANLRYGIPIDVNFTQTQNYYFSTGLTFQHLGGKYKFTMPVINQNGDSISPLNSRLYRSIYLTIPTGVKLKTPEFNNFVFGVNFGFYHSIRLSSRIVDKYEVENRKIVQKTPNYNKNSAIFREAGYMGIGGEYIIKDAFRAHLYLNYVYTFTNFFSVKNEVGEKGNLHSLEVVAGFNF